MTNWKDEDQKKNKAKKHDNGTGKRKQEAEWKKVTTTSKAVVKIQAVGRRKSEAASSPLPPIVDNSRRKLDVEWKKVANASKAVKRIKVSYRRKTQNEGQKQIENEAVEVQKEPETETAEIVADEQQNADETADKTQVIDEKAPDEQHKSEPAKSKKTGGKHGGKSKKNKAVAAIFEKELKPSEEEDPVTVARNKVFEVIKNAFSLAYTDDEELRINVDNIFPILKALELNPQSESVCDLVRDACMESTGEIDPKEFEDVVMALIKEQDDELWTSRLEEKQFLFWDAEEKAAKLEEERLRLEQERAKAGFAKEEGNVDEWAEYERLKKVEVDKKAKEKQEDELYDNLKMAFKFIDADEDGVISTKDLYALMMGMGEMLTDDELFGMVNTADCDCDGKVTFKDFKKFLNPGQEDDEEEDSTIPPEPVKPTDGEGTEVKDGDDKTDAEKAQSLSDAVVKQLEEAANAKDKPAPPEPTQEEIERAKRRKRSILQGYTKKAPTVVKPVDEVPVTKEVIPEEPEANEEPMTSEGTVQVKVIETDETKQEDKNGDPNEDAEKADSGNFLDSIKEEDEHSNYGPGNTAGTGAKADNKTTSLAAENKRKLFSRQGSAGSLKNKPNSVVTGTDSIGDSGIETLDTIYGSEIREQPDTFDISDAESESTRGTSQRAGNRRKSKSHKDVYNAEEEDEDMIEPRHVFESLSRVNSMDSLDDAIDVVSGENDIGKNSTADSEERTRTFVEQHMYVEVEPIEEETDESRERLRRAELLEKAILRRSATAPSMIMYSSKLNRPQTPKPSVNGYSCSHIDIDLMCDAPPKADIKSDSVERRSRTPVSARSRGEIHDRAMSDRRMNIVDLSECMSNCENLPNHYDLPKWPSRPLTRPRSPTHKRIASAKERQTKHANTMEDIDTDRATNRKPRLRCQSAVAFFREPVPRPVSPRRVIKRPQTAQMPYTKSKRMENVVTNFEKNDNVTVVVSEPFLNSDELYPNKTKFTTYHHGFKSIWPIGRNINLMKDKRPFSAFEMNSYSRSIERREFPFKNGNRSETISPLSVRAPVVKPEPEVPSIKKTLIQLELNTDGIKKPTGRKILVRSGFTPRSITTRT